MNNLLIKNLLCNGMKEPLGISFEEITLSWNIEGLGNNVLQNACEIEISKNISFEKKEIVYSNILKNYFMPFINISEKFEEKTSYYWRVRTELCIEKNNNIWTEWSDPSLFETGFGESPFENANWIEADEEFYKAADSICKKFWKKNKELNFFAQTTPGNPEDFPLEDQGLRRLPYLKQEFDIEEAVESARAYITARGFYELFLNGHKVGKDGLTPDFTVYDKCIYYQTYDVGKYLKKGKNVLEVILADGWFAGHAQSIPGSNHLYGTRPAAIYELDLKYLSGKKQQIVSDNTVVCESGELLYADLFMGEYYDEYASRGVYGTVIRDYDKSVLMAQEDAMVTAIKHLDAIEVNKIEDGSYIVDFGQVLAGRESIYLEKEVGNLIKIEHSEILKRDGSGDIDNVIPDNFPFHDQSNFVRTKQENFLYEPQFSFQGFRYLKISGMKGEVKKENCKAVVLETELKDSYKFQCNNSKINQLTQNSYWSQIGNMISIPTDCPQRERGGFTGDAQIFCKTAAWHQDVYGFFGRWLKQCRLEQFPRGQIPITVPYTKGYSPGAPNPAWTSAGWGDAIIFVPWDLYLAYGNKKVLEQNFEAMEKWLNYVQFCAEESMPERFYMDENRRWQKYLWNTGYHWGDWLLPNYSSVDGVILTKEITSSIFYFREVSVMCKVAETLGYDSKLKYYRELLENIRTAFLMFYVTEDQRLTVDIQGSYVMAIAFELAEGELKQKFGERLHELVVENGYHLATGFLSTPYLLDCLWECGYEETALKVLYQDTCPSWLYSVKKGATTIWECWYDTADEPISSYNHYAFGAVCDFIYRKAAGIYKIESGFQKIEIQPKKIEGMENGKLQYQTPFGELLISWNYDLNDYYSIKIPHGMNAVVNLKNGPIKLGSGKWILTRKEGVRKC